MSNNDTHQLTDLMTRVRMCELTEAELAAMIVILAPAVERVERGSCNVVQLRP